MSRSSGPYFTRSSAKLAKETGTESLPASSDSSTRHFTRSSAKLLKESRAESDPVPASSYPSSARKRKLSAFENSPNLSAPSEPQEAQQSSTPNTGEVHQGNERPECSIGNCNLSSYDGEKVFEQMERPASKLCVHCQNVFDHWDEISKAKRGRFPHCESEDALKASAEGGCGLCTQFLMNGREVGVGDVFDDMRGDDGKVTSGGVLVLRSGPDIIFNGGGRLGCRSDYWRIGLLFPVTLNDAMNLDLDDAGTSWNSTMDGSYRVGCRAFTVDMSPAPHAAIFYDAQQAFLVSTRDALPLSRAWLQQCMEGHDQCHATEKYQPPTRLIFIGDSKVRLCLAQELDECPQYATLSHCWGSLPFETLKRGNLETFRQRIPSTALTKTFRDAIDTARYLGFQYLWIDSLCIIQDDSNDWDVEASLMTNVYGNSGLNIAASDTVDGNAGLFFARDSSWRCQIRVIAGDEESLYDCYPENLPLNFELSPLALRGWTTQERILSPRTLHFSRTQIVWECAQKMSCELFPCDCSEPASEHEWGRSPKGPLKLKPWTEMIQRYSWCELTYSKDRLVAISGLARMSQTETNEEYVAGLWRDCLEIQLCWSTISPKQRIVPYVAPTWSWASIYGAVEFDFRSYRGPEDLCIKVVDVQVVHVSQNLLGQISGAKIRLSCRYFIRSSIQMDGHFRLDLMRFPGKSITSMVQFDCFSTSRGQVIDAFVVLVKKHGYDEETYVSGLLLESVGEGRGVYQRIGVFRFSNAQSEKFRKAFKSGILHPEDRDCVEISVDDRDRKQYIIDII